MKVRQLLHRLPAQATRGRAAHTLAITENLHYVTNEHANVTADKDTMKLNKGIDRPVCVILNWLSASERNSMKYGNLYLDHGFDVLRVHSVPNDVFFPVRGSQVIARDLLKLMSANKATYVLHGLSIGSYIWSEALLQAMADIKLYKPVLDQVAAQVWDSIGDVTSTPTGFSYHYFPRSSRARTIAGWLFDPSFKVYMKVCYDTVTVHYERAQHAFLNTGCRAPALFLLSSTDSISSPHFIRNIHDTWRQNGIQCTWHCWEKSSHVQHLLEHPEKYVALLRAHLRENVPELRKQYTEGQTLSARSTARQQKRHEMGIRATQN